MEEVHMIEYGKLLQRAVQQPNWPAMEAELGKIDLRRKPPDNVAIAFAAIFLPSLNRATQTHERIEGDRRMIAVSLAIQLYRADHDGDFPADLNALRSDVCCKDSSRPLRPRRAAGLCRAASVLPDGGDRPLVYSVSEDGNDDTAARTYPIVAEPYYGWRGDCSRPWRDLPRPLHRPRRRRVRKRMDS